MKPVTTTGQMNISPELYNSHNYLQRRDGRKLIQRIVDDLQDMHFDKVVDIGCGTGNITDELAARLSYGELIGLDINDSMIEFAATHYERKGLEFTVADICEEWPKLSAKLDLTENSIDLIVSVYCLHWVSDLHQAMKNIAKLLKPDGHCYIMLFSWSDLLPIQQKMALMDEWQQYFYAIPKNYANMGAKKKETIRKLSEHLAPFPVFEAPKEEGCLAKWQQICVDNGLLVPETVLTHTYYKFDNLKQFRNVLRALCHFLPFIPDDRVQEFLDQYFKIIDQEYLANQIDAHEMNEQSSVKLHYDYIIVVANKCHP